MKLIGLAGPAGVGKTTIANLIQKYADYEIKSFAGPLKKSLVEATGLDPRYFYDIDYKEKPTIYGKTAREIMQLFGTEFVRNLVNPDFWLLRMEMEIKRCKAVVIDDIRFDNEANFVRERGGIIIHLFREYDQVTEKINHISEKRINRYNHDLVVDSGKYDENRAFNLIKSAVKL